MNPISRVLAAIGRRIFRLRLRTLVVGMFIVLLGLVAYGVSSLPGNALAAWLALIVLYFSTVVFLLRVNREINQRLDIERTRSESAVAQETKRRTAVMDAQRRSIIDMSKYRDRTLEEVVDEFRDATNDRIDAAVCNAEDSIHEFESSVSGRMDALADDFEARLATVLETGQATVHAQAREEFDAAFEELEQELRQCRLELESTRAERATWMEKFFELKTKLDHLEESLRGDIADERQRWAARYQSERELAAKESQLEREHAAKESQLEREHATNELRAETERTYREVSRLSDRLRDEVQETLERQVSECKQAAQEEARKERDARNAALDRRDKKWFQTFRRVLSEEDETELFKMWNKSLGVDFQRSQIRYLQHKVSEIESRCVGRLALSVQQALLNLFVVRAVKGERLDYLEIGTLFGVNSVLTYAMASQWFKQVHLTIVDPLEGYYGKNALDPATGMPVSQATLTHNLMATGVPTSDYQIINDFSGGSKALAEAGKRQYDVIFIDGDHSYDGVKADFDNYAPMLKPGGFLVFDDYDDPSWPDVAKCVNECVRGRADFRCVGDAWNTAIFLRKA